MNRIPEAIYLDDLLKKVRDRYKSGWTRQFDFSSYVTQTEDEKSLLKIRPFLKQRIDNFNFLYENTFRDQVLSICTIFDVGNDFKVPTVQYQKNALDEIFADLHMSRPNAFGYCQFSYRPDPYGEVIDLDYGNNRVSILVRNSDQDPGSKYDTLVINLEDGTTTVTALPDGGNLMNISTYHQVPLKIRIVLIAMILIAMSE